MSEHVTLEILGTTERNHQLAISMQKLCVYLWNLPTVFDPLHPHIPLLQLPELLGVNTTDETPSTHWQGRPQILSHRV